MDIYITLDYELFFGDQSGTVDDCIISPTASLLAIADKYNVKLNLFVDAGFLVKLKCQKNDYPALQKDYEKVAQQLTTMASHGHGIELHIHPHWEDSYYDGKKWVFDTKRYKLSDFSKTEVMDIVTRYNAVLKEITGEWPVAFRAGGWSIQPFDHVKEALRENGILIDSTVFPNGAHESPNQYYNFEKVKQYKTLYRFSDNIVQEDSSGKFTEIPISSYQVSPLFFWKFAFNKIFSRQKHSAFGDGVAIAKPKKEILKLMTKASYSVVSIDGYKGSFIKKAFKKYVAKTKDSGHFVLIGHPKAFSDFSLQKTEQFIREQHEKHTFKTFRNTDVNA